MIIALADLEFLAAGSHRFSSFEQSLQVTGGTATGRIGKKQGQTRGP
jgi:hypothetical protein